MEHTSHGVELLSARMEVLLQKLIESELSMLSESKRPDSVNYALANRVHDMLMLGQAILRMESLLQDVGMPSIPAAELCNIETR